MKKIKRHFCFLIVIIIGILVILLNNNTQKEGNIVDDLNVVQSNVVVNAKKIADAEQNVTIEPHIDESTGVKYVTYEDFGAKAQEGYDDYNVIKETHDFANKNKYEVRAEKDKTYHIYRLNDTGIIHIQTNTNWNNANIVIHDEDIKDRDTKNYSIFKIESDTNYITIRDSTILNNIVVNKQTKKIDELSGYGNCLCIVYNEDKKQYIRSGQNKNSGTTQEDLFKIDNEGNVLGDIQWDFEKITSIRLIKIPEETLTVENVKFTTVLPENNYEQDSGYFSRNIMCNRSNTELKNITHNVSNSEIVAGPYYGFLKISYVTDVILKDSSLYSHKYSTKSNYDLILEHSTNVTIDNVISNDIEDTHRWGITGTNYTKDITYRNCTLNRIDAHCGVHNLTIENCTVGVKGLSLVGSGELNLKNITRLGDSAFINLRSDYGSTWDGNINIENCIYKPTNSNQLINFEVTYDNNEVHDFGYDLHLPNININNFKIEDENNTNNSSEYYIFNNVSNKTGTENGDITNAYNLPNNITINNYQTESGKKIKLFYNKFYDGLDELGINLSIPLSDKEEVEITNEVGEKITDGIITNQDVKINKKEIEGIKTTVKVDNEELIETEKILEQEGNYKIEIIYQNTVGEYEKDAINVSIDKTPPVVSGVENGITYSNSVIPQVSDEHLEEVQLKLNGQVVEGFASGNEIREEGIYELIARDKANNETRVGFEIKYKLEPESEEYRIDGQYILGVRNNTTLEKFIEILNGNVGYAIYRNEEVLQKEDIVATGDTLVTEYGKTFYIIVKGDITKDGITNIKDLVWIRRKILGLEEFDELQLKAADMFSDEVINIKDLVRIRRIILGIE